MSICTSGANLKNKFWIITSPANNCVHVLLRTLAISTHFLSTGVKKNQTMFISILFCAILEVAFAIRIPIYCSCTTSIQTRDIQKYTAKFASAISPHTSIQQFIAQNVTLPSTNVATALKSSLREIFSATSACIIRTANRVKVRLLYLVSCLQLQFLLIECIVGCCLICNKTGFHLKRMLKVWFHVTCLIFTNSILVRNLRFELQDSFTFDSIAKMVAESTLKFFFFGQFMFNLLP